MPKFAKPHLENKTVLVTDPLIASFERHLRAERKDADTVAHYAGSAKQYLAFALTTGLPSLRVSKREHIELWLETLHKTYAPASVRNRFIGLRLFYKWLATEGEIRTNPMAKIKPPSLEETQKDVVSPDDMQKLLTFLEKAKRWRDVAVISLIYDTGMRATELADCLLENVDLEKGRIVLPKTKNNSIRIVAVSPKGLRALDRYLRTNRPAPTFLINGKAGRLTRSGVYFIVRTAFADAGFTEVIGPHDLRHTSATHVAGVLSESAMMQLYGWSDSAMARHYAKQAQQETALEAHKAASPLERLPKPKKG